MPKNKSKKSNRFKQIFNRLSNVQKGVSILCFIVIVGLISWLFYKATNEPNTGIVSLGIEKNNPYFGDIIGVLIGVFTFILAAIVIDRINEQKEINTEEIANYRYDKALSDMQKAMNEIATFLNEDNKTEAIDITKINHEILHDRLYRYVLSNKEVFRDVRENYQDGFSNGLYTLQQYMYFEKLITLSDYMLYIIGRYEEIIDEDINDDNITTKYQGLVDLYGKYNKKINEKYIPLINQEIQKETMDVDKINQEVESKEFDPRNIASTNKYEIMKDRLSRHYVKLLEEVYPKVKFKYDTKNAYIFAYDDNNQLKLAINTDYRDKNFDDPIAKYKALYDKVKKINGTDELIESVKMYLIFVTKEKSNESNIKSKIEEKYKGLSEEDKNKYKNIIAKFCSIDNLVDLDIINDTEK